MPAFALALAVGLLFVAGVASATQSPQVYTFRIGTGGPLGTYYPIGSLIARGLNNIFADCRLSPACSLPAVVGVAQLSNGSVANVEALTRGELEAALVQADVAHWAWSGTGPYRRAHPQLRSLGCLYEEQVHVVSRAVDDIKSVADLAGRRVSLDEPGSGALVTARMVLAAHGLDESDIIPVYLKPRFAAERLGADALDAYFVVAGHPAETVTRLASGGDVRLLPIRGEPAQRLLRLNPFLNTDLIPANAYPGQPAVQTMSVAAQVLVRADLPTELVSHVTSSLWSDATLATLREGHARGGAIDPVNALGCLTVPLHPGAARAYAGRGVTVPPRLLVNPG